MFVPIVGRRRAWAWLLALLPLLAGCLTQTPPDVVGPTPTATAPPLPPVGGRIAFLSTRRGQRELWAINPAGSGETGLLPGRPMFATVWAPDGRRLAFVADQGGKAQIGVLLVNTDNSPAQSAILTGDVPSSDNTRPAWSPDERTLAFQSNRSGSYQVYTIPSTGGPVASFPNQPAWAGAPAWSPDGRTLAFAGGADSDHTELYTVPATGGSPTQITNAGHGANIPSWSPDGQWLLCIVRTPEGGHTVAEVHPDGTGQRALGSAAAAGFPSEDQYPIWSPDGNWIAFTSDRTRNNDVFVMDKDGATVTDVSNAPGGDLDPAWAPDSSRLVFASNRADGAHYRLYVVGRDGANLTPLTQSSGDYDDVFPMWSRAP